MMSTRFIISPNVCSATDKDGSTILNIESGILYSTIGFASRVWTRLKARPEGLSLGEIIASIGTDWPSLEIDRIRLNVETLLNQLTDKGLVETTNGENSQIVGLRAWLSRIIPFLSLTSTKAILKLRLNCLASFAQLLYFDLILKIGGFRALHNGVRNWPLATAKDWREETIQKLNEALNRAARYYPKHSLCLQRSAVLTCLLRSHGISAELVIACRRIPFKGHAWVEVKGKVVNDNPKAQTFYSSVLERC